MKAGANTGFGGSNNLDSLVASVEAVGTRALSGENIDSVLQAGNQFATNALITSHVGVTSSCVPWSWSKRVKEQNRSWIQYIDRIYIYMYIFGQTRNTDRIYIYICIYQIDRIYIYIDIKIDRYIDRCKEGIVVYCFYM